MKSQRLELDFAPNAHRVSRIGVPMLVVAAAALAFGAFELADMVATNNRLSDTLAAVDARRDMAAARMRKPAAPDAAEAARTRSIRQVSQSLMTPWGDLLESLESVPTTSVAVLSIEPSVSKRSIRITAEARTPQDMIAYLRALAREPRLSSVVLASHQVQMQAPGTPVRFQVRAAWGAPQ